MNIPTTTPLRKNAFSLVEVTMALGIFAFALIGLLGLIPAAVTTHKEAKQDTVLTQIKQRLAAEVLLTDAEKLGELDGFERRFDVEGREIDPNEQNADAKTVYRGKIVLDEFKSPGGHTSDSLQRVMLYAVHDPTSDGKILDNAKPSGSLLVPGTKSSSVASSSGGASVAGL